MQSFEFLYHRVMKEKENFMEATSMDKKQVIKTVINVLPIFIVPLVVERKKSSLIQMFKKLRMQLHMLHIQ